MFRYTFSNISSLIYRWVKLLNKTSMNDKNEVQEKLICI